MSIAIIATALDPKSAMVLPNPNNINWKLSLNIDKKSARSGMVYTYVADTNRQAFTLQFAKLMLGKLKEVEEFFNAYSADRVMIYLFNGQIWEANFENPNIPLSFSGSQHSCNTEFGDFTLAFVEGILLNA